MPVIKPEHFDRFIDMIEMVVKTRDAIMVESHFDCRCWTLEFNDKLTVAVDKYGDTDDQRVFYRCDEGDNWFVHAPSVESAIARFVADRKMLEDAPDSDFVSEEEASEITGISVEELRKARGE